MKLSSCKHLPEISMSKKKLLLSYKRTSQHPLYLSSFLFSLFSYRTFSLSISKPKKSVLMNTTKRFALYALLLVFTFSSCKKMEDLNLVTSTEDGSADVISYSASKTAVVTPTGLYAVQAVDKPQDEAILQNPNIDGIFIRTRWSSIEATKGIYNWSYLDGEIDKAVRYGKKVEIAIIAGEYTPLWLETKGVRFLDFKVIPHGGEGNPHWTHLPIVWDTRFVSSYIKMVKAFAAHIKASTSRYNAISLIKFEGINQETAEIRLPYQNDSYIKGTDTASNCAEIWAANGYTAAKIVSVWEKIASIYQAAFPDKALGMAIIGDPRGFPSIDDYGNIIPEELNITTQRLVDKTLLCDRSIILFNALTEEPVEPAMLNYISESNGMVSFQEKEAYPLKSDAWVENMVKNGINCGAKYIELFNETIYAYPNGVSKARALF